MKLTILPLNLLKNNDYAFVEDMVATIKRFDLFDIIYDVTVIPLLGEDIYTGEEIITLNIFLTGNKKHKFTEYMAEGIECMADKYNVNVAIHRISTLQRCELQRDMIDPISINTEVV